MSAFLPAFAPIEALSALSPHALNVVSAPDLPPPAATQPAPVANPAALPATGSFGQLVADGIAQVNGQLIGSQIDLQKLAVGDAQNLHQIMINMEESRVSFQLMLQVRSRLLEAYQDIMKMPI